MKWIFVRHGQTVSNQKNVYGGWGSEGLTAEGVEQAKDAAGRLAGKMVQKIFCSPIQRALQTAAIIGEKLQITPVPDEHFTELQYGVWAGMSENEIARTYSKEWGLWNSRPADLAFPGRETLRHMQDRVLEGIRLIGQNLAHENNVLVVTHVAVIRGVLLYVNKMDLNLYRTIPVSNAEIFEFPGELFR